MNIDLKTFVPPGGGDFQGWAAYLLMGEDEFTDAALSDDGLAGGAAAYAAGELLSKWHDYLNDGCPLTDLIQWVTDDVDDVIDELLSFKEAVIKHVLPATLGTDVLPNGSKPEHQLALTAAYNAAKDIRQQRGLLIERTVAALVNDVKTFANTTGIVMTCSSHGDTVTIIPYEGQKSLDHIELTFEPGKGWAVKNNDTGKYHALEGGYEGVLREIGKRLALARS